MSKLQGLSFGLATVVLVVLATGYFMRDWLPPLKSDRGAIDEAMAATLVVTGLVFIATNLLLAFVAWRYEDHEGAKAAYWHDNTRLEIAWTAVTAVIMFAFLFNALKLWADMTSEAPRDAVVVEVTGQQFRWVVRYPGKDGAFGKTDAAKVDVDTENYIGLDKSDPDAKDDVLMVNDVYLPVGKPAAVRIRSTDVIHSFFLPNFRVKQDALPGMTTKTWFIPKVEGDYEIACAEHCGLGHYKMKGQLHVLSPDAFEAKLVELGPAAPEAPAGSPNQASE
ncbi:MAG: cytochrome c oxidase subunit II [Acidobacteria bacterium]|nr:cytochrome c oxidase subunit II [Acidobacteriota bacterium]